MLKFHFEQVFNKRITKALIRLHRCPGLSFPLLFAYLGLVARKPVFRVSNKASFKPVSSATEKSWKIEILFVARLYMVLSKKRITKALIRLCGCAGWSALLLLANLRRQVFRDEAHFTHNEAHISSSIIFSGKSRQCPEDPECTWGGCLPRSYATESRRTRTTINCCRQNYGVRSRLSVRG